MQGLKFFSRTSSPDCWNIASYHSPHSMTWRWFVSFALFRGDEARVRPLWFSHRTNNGLQWGFRVPWVGLVTFQQQRPMWYRDLYQRKRDEVDGLRRDMDHPPSSTPPRSPFNPVVIDGGPSLH